MVSKTCGHNIKFTFFQKFELKMEGEMVTESPPVTDIVDQEWFNNFSLTCPLIKILLMIFFIFL